MPITATSDKTASVFRNVDWTCGEDSSAPILRKAAKAAVLQDSRIEIAFDHEIGDYTLANSAAR